MQLCGISSVDGACLLGIRETNVSVSRIPFIWWTDTLTLALNQSAHVWCSLARDGSTEAQRRENNQIIPSYCNSKSTRDCAFGWILKTKVEGRSNPFEIEARFLPTERRLKYFVKGEHPFTFSSFSSNLWGFDQANPDQQKHPRMYFESICEKLTKQFKFFNAAFKMMFTSEVFS